MYTHECGVKIAKYKFDILGQKRTLAVLSPFLWEEAFYLPDRTALSGFRLGKGVGVWREGEKEGV